MCWLRKTCRPDAERDGVLQVRADGEDRRQLGRAAAPAAARSRARGAAAELAPADDPRDGVVHVARDRPVVDQEQVGDAAEARRAPRARRCRSARRRGCRWWPRRGSRARAAAGGAAACTAASRRGRVAGRDRRRRRRRAGRARGSSTIGASGDGEQRAPPRPSTSHSARAAVEVGHHQREGLLLAALARAQAARPPPSLRASTIRWKPPSPLTATIRPSRSASPRAAQRVVAARPAPAPARVPQRELRAAGRAGVRLGVEAAVARVLVLGAAVPGTCAKPRIVVFGPVVGQRLDDA